MTKKYNSDDEYSDDPNTVIQFNKYSINAINNNNEDYFVPVIDEINNNDNLYFIYKDLTNFCKYRGLFLLDNVRIQDFRELIENLVPEKK